jgi:rRNA maturation protein Nop10
MAEDQNQPRQGASRQAAAEERQRAGEQGGSLALCKYCGAELEEGDMFCPRCSEKVGGEEQSCPFCQTRTTAEMCPKCGKRVVPLACPKCGNFTIDDVCEQCGVLLNPALEALLSQGAPEPAAMTEEKIAEIRQAFQDEAESPELKAFQKKLLERQILLEERDYFNNREKRIVKVFGARPFTLELPDPDEEAFRIKAYAALEKTVIEKRERLIQEELEKLFPKAPQEAPVEIDEAAQLADLTRRREEMERKYQKLLSQVENEVEEFREEERRKELARIAEEKRKEEERLRLEAERKELERKAAEARRERQRQQERQRLEQEVFQNRICGTYYHGNPRHDYEYIQIRINSNSTAQCKHHCEQHGDSFGEFSVAFDGQNVRLHPRSFSMSNKDCPLLHSKMHRFIGTLNNAGTILSGYWDNFSVTHYKY